MTAARLDWGIVGCGWVARDYVAPAIASSRNGRLVAVHDTHAPAMAAFAPAQPYASLDALLRHAGLRAVYVATPNHAHRAVVQAAAAAGLAVLCEKPMARSATEAQAMLRACAEAGVLYATAFDQRFHAAHQQLAARIADGALGRVVAIRIVYACWLGPDWAVDNWRVDRARAGGGALIDLAPHGLDLATMLLGEPLVEVAALGQARVHAYADPEVEDGAMLVALSRSGALVQLHVAYNCPDALPRRRIEVVGTRALAVAEDTMGQVGGGRVTLHDARTGVAASVAVPDIERSPFLAQVEAFADCVLERRPFPFEAAHDVAVMRLVERAQAMARPRAEVA